MNDILVDDREHAVRRCTMIDEEASDRARVRGEAVREIHCEHIHVIGVPEVH
jgi:hypothetical protein